MKFKNLTVCWYSGCVVFHFMKGQRGVLWDAGNKIPCRYLFVSTGYLAEDISVLEHSIVMPVCHIHGVTFMCNTNLLLMTSDGLLAFWKLCFGYPWSDCAQVSVLNPDANTEIWWVVFINWKKNTFPLLIRKFLLVRCWSPWRILSFVHWGWYIANEFHHFQCNRKLMKRRCPENQNLLWVSSLGQMMMVRTAH